MSGAVDRPGNIAMKAQKQTVPAAGQCGWNRHEQHTPLFTRKYAGHLATAAHLPDACYNGVTYPPTCGKAAGIKQAATSWAARGPVRVISCHLDGSSPILIRGTLVMGAKHAVHLSSV
jgi:hypothetical protein